MKFFSRHAKTLIRGFLLTCMVLIASVGIVFVAGTVQVKADGNDNNEDIEDISFYKISQNAQMYFSEAKNLSKDGEVRGLNGAMSTWPQNSKDATTDAGYSNDNRDTSLANLPGNAGVFVGYSDQSFFAALLTNSSVSYAYETFGYASPWQNGHPASDSKGGIYVGPFNGDPSEVNIFTKGNSAYTTAIRDYAYYGYLLSQLGLDQTATETSFSLLPSITGYAMYFLYIIALAIPLFFHIIISVLKALNPFKLFTVGADSLITNYLGTMGPNNALYGLASVVTSLYNSFQQLSMAAIVPIFIVMLIVWTLLLRRGGETKRKIRDFAIRILFIGLGIPVLGGTYTVCLDAMSEASSTNATASTQIIGSMFVDFEAWAKNARLAVPKKVSDINGISYDIANTASVNTESVSLTGPGIVPTTDAMMNVRATAWYINGLSHDSTTLFKGDSKYIVKFTQAGNTATGSTTATTFSGLTDAAYEGTENDASAVAVQKVLTDMLKRYRSGSFYYGSDFESDVKGELTRIYDSASDAGKGTLNQVREAADEKTWKLAAKLNDSHDPDLKSDDKDAKGAFFNRLLNTEYGNGYNIFLNGGLQVKGSGSTFNYYESKLSPAANNLSGIVSRSSSSNGKKYGLSTFSLYNYLNSSFNESGIVCYSSEKASSGFIRKGHKSVSLVGTGLSKPLYWLDGCILLLVFIVIGFWYCFGIMFSNIKRGIRMIMAVPMAMLGAMRAIAKVVVYSVMMIIEIIASFVLYDLIMELAMAAPTVLMTPLATAMVSNVRINSMLANIYTPLSLIVEMVIYIIMLIMALRLRKSFVKSIDEAAAKLIDKFLNTGSSAQGAAGVNRPSAAKRLAGAGAGALGMAAGSAMMSNMMKDKNGPQKGVAGESGGANGVNADGVMTEDSVNGVEPNTDANELPGGSAVLPGTSTPTGHLLEANKAIADKVGDDIGTPLNENGLSDAEENKLHEQLGLNGDSAVESEDKQEAERMQKKDNKAVAEAEKQQAAKDMAAGGAKAVVGGAEAIVGAKTGNAELAEDGVQNMAAGAGEMSEANAKREQAAANERNAGRDATEQTYGRSNKSQSEQQSTRGVRAESQQTSGGNSRNGSPQQQQSQQSGSRNGSTQQSQQQARQTGSGRAASQQHTSQQSVSQQSTRSVRADSTQHTSQNNRGGNTTNHSNRTGDNNTANVMTGGTNINSSVNSSGPKFSGMTSVNSKNIGGDNNSRISAMNAQSSTDKSLNKSDSRNAVDNRNNASIRSTANVTAMTDKPTGGKSPAMMMGNVGFAKSKDKAVSANANANMNMGKNGLNAGANASFDRSKSSSKSFGTQQTARSGGNTYVTNNVTNNTKNQSKNVNMNNKIDTHNLNTFNHKTDRSTITKSNTTHQTTKQNTFNNTTSNINSTNIQNNSSTNFTNQQMNVQGIQNPIHAGRELARKTPPTGK